MTGPARRPLIVIGVPCYGLVGPEVLEDFARFTYHLGRRMPAYDFNLAIKTKSEQFRARNAIVDAAIQVNADYILMIDDDMIINAAGTQGVQGEGSPDEYGFLEKLIAHDKDVCGVLYYQRVGTCDPVLMMAAGETGYRFLRDNEITGGLQEVDVAGGGCLLIKSRVFDKLQYPYFEPEFRFGTDIQLCRKAKEKGFSVFADTSIEFGHLRIERVTITGRNRHQYQMSDTLPGEMKKTFITSDIYERVVNDVLAYSHAPDLETLFHAVDPNAFMQRRQASGLSDADWYREFPRDRVVRQIWFNTQNKDKRAMTEYVLAAVDHHKRLDVLDFGCGIGIPAFHFAEKGHRVTACDIQGTGTLEFLKWRTEKHGVPMTFHESTGGVPHLGGAQYDAIIAMDCLEHIADWRLVVQELARHLKPNGVLFANNAILEDLSHPEHYPIDGKDFITVCMDAGLRPFNQVTYVKKAAPASPPVAPQELAHAAD